MQIRRKEEAADQASADLARKVVALHQKDKSAAEKEQSLSSLTAELWAKASLPDCIYIALQLQSAVFLYSCTLPQLFCSVGDSLCWFLSLEAVDCSLCITMHQITDVCHCKCSLLSAKA